MGRDENGLPKKRLRGRLAKSWQGGKKEKGSSRFIFVFADPTISEPGTGSLVHRPLERDCTWVNFCCMCRRSFSAPTPLWSILESIIDPILVISVQM